VSWRPQNLPASTPKPGILSKVRHIIAVSSGKGGVGKSMAAANLAAAMAGRGLVVGLLDADIYGPNIPLMFGVSRRPNVTGEQGASDDRSRCSARTHVGVGKMGSTPRPPGRCGTRDAGWARAGRGGLPLIHATTGSSRRAAALRGRTARN